MFSKKNASLSVVIPVGNFATDHKNIYKILTTNNINLFQLIIVMDNQSETQINGLNAFIHSNNIINTIVTKGNWSNPGAARNHGLKLCTENWVMFWDSDDQPHSSAIRTAVEQLNRGSFDCGFGIFEMEINGTNFPENILKNSRSGVSFSDRLISNPGLWRFIFNLNFIRGINFPELASSEDQVFLQRFLGLNPNILILQEKIYTYVMGGSNQLTKSDNFVNQNIQAILIGIAEINDINNPRIKIIGCLIFKQIITVIKNGSISEKLLGIKLSIKLVKKLKVHNTIIIINNILKILMVRICF
jgi:glycosyltransferase involved in cell wall biosynthesis